MIVFCPNAFLSQISGKGAGELERGFIKTLASETGEKMVVANEVWETFRFKIMDENEDQIEAENFIASFRSIFRPEKEVIGADGKEVPPVKAHNKEILMEKTKDLIKRRYLDIKFFITPNINDYENEIEDIPSMDIDSFYYNAPGVYEYRKLLDKYWRSIEHGKYSEGFF